mmetsp:Transcript_43181/g.85140  ORF Transcript_43181/g.85140 Transcript_43181/m.85140 type:complete len:245 (-) Transcript_43181:100-834(-)
MHRQKDAVLLGTHMHESPSLPHNECTCMMHARRGRLSAVCIEQIRPHAKKERKKETLCRSAGAPSVSADPARRQEGRISQSVSCHRAAHSCRLCLSPQRSPNPADPSLDLSKPLLHLCFPTPPCYRPPCGVVGILRKLRFDRLSFDVQVQQLFVEYLLVKIFLLIPSKGSRSHKGIPTASSLPPLQGSTSTSSVSAPSHAFRLRDAAAHTRSPSSRRRTRRDPAALTPSSCLGSCRRAFCCHCC